MGRAGAGTLARAAGVCETRFVSTLLRRYPVTGFYLLAYALTWSLAVPSMLSQRGLMTLELPLALEPVAAFGPFVAALLVARALQGRAGPRAILKSLGHWHVDAGTHLLALGSPVVLLLLALSIAAFIGGGPTLGTPGAAELTTAAGVFDLIVIGGLLQACGEEPGWRGFALSTLRQRFGPFLATLVLWPVWLIWHLPFFLSRPQFGWVQWLAFSAGILSAAVWLTLIWDRSRSILMCVGWHAVVNICRGIALAISTATFLAMSNLVLLGAMVIALGWGWRRRRKAGSARTVV